VLWVWNPATYTEKQWESDEVVKKRTSSQYAWCFFNRWLHTHIWHSLMFRFADVLHLQAVCKTVWHIPLLCVQWKTPDDGQRNCPNHVGFYSKNKFEKLVHMVRFIIRMNHTHTHIHIYTHTKKWKYHEYIEVG